MPRSDNRRNRMSKPIVELDVRETDLVRTLEMLFYNDYQYVVVKPNRDARPIYHVEAHIGETE